MSIQGRLSYLGVSPTAHMHIIYQMNKNGVNYYQIDETRNTIKERWACHKINENSAPQ